MTRQRKLKKIIPFFVFLIVSVGTLLPILSPETWNLISQIALALAVIPAFLFPVFYVFWPWHRTHAGTMLMLSSFGLMLLVVLAAIFRVLDMEAPHWIRAVVYLIIVSGLWYQLGLLAWSWRKNRRERRRYYESLDIEYDSEAQ